MTGKPIERRIYELERDLERVESRRIYDSDKNEHLRANVRDLERWREAIHRRRISFLFILLASLGELILFSPFIVYAIMAQDYYSFDIIIVLLTALIVFGNPFVILLGRHLN